MYRAISGWLVHRSAMHRDMDAESARLKFLARTESLSSAHREKCIAEPQNYANFPVKS